MRLQTFLQSQTGAVSSVTALLGVALIGFAGLATDVGSVYLQSRRLQGSVDLAALAAAQNPARSEAAVRATVNANNWDEDARIAVRSGCYTPDRALRPTQRFQPAAGQPNAVNVAVTTSTPLFFARLFVPSGRMTITRRATAAQTRLASFQIGSRLLSLRGGVANALLSGLTGSSVNLSVMDYQCACERGQVFAGALNFHAQRDPARCTEPSRAREYSVLIGAAGGEAKIDLAQQRVRGGTSNTMPMSPSCASKSRLTGERVVTGEDGRILVTGLRPFESNRVGIDIADLPWGAQVTEDEIEVTPEARSGVIASFEINASAGGEMRVTDSNGAPLPRGALLVRESDGARFPVGANGRVYLFEVSDADTLIAADGCIIRVTSQHLRAESPLVCEPA